MTLPQLTKTPPFNGIENLSMSESAIMPQIMVLLHDDGSRKPAVLLKSNISAQGKFVKGVL